MKFNKDTKLVKIEASATGYYSDTKAYGEIYMPEEIYEQYYEQHKEYLADMCIETADLDTESFHVECDIKVKKGTLKHFIDTEKWIDFGTHKDINDEVSEQIKNVMEITEESIDALIELSTKIFHMSRIVEKTIELPEDTVINKILVPKGTILKYSSNPEISDLGVVFEIDFNGFDM